MTQARTMVKPAALIAILVILAIVVLQATMVPQPLAQKEREEAEEEAGESEAFPPALAGHLEELSKTLPGNQGMSLEGPGSAAEAAYLARAYPSDTISVAQMDGQVSLHRVDRRPFPVARDERNLEQHRTEPGALPDTEFRTSFSYVPNEYVGRRPDDVDRHRQPVCRASAGRGSRRPAAACGGP